MTKNLPAIRYELFIKAFEKKVTAAQAEIERLRAMEAPYNLLKEVMEAERLPNDQQITLGSSNLSVHITAVPADTMAAFEALAERLGQRLRDGGLHTDGVPSFNHGGSSACLFWQWHGHLPAHRLFTVQIYIALPDGGLIDCDLLEVERRTVDTEYVVRRKEAPRYPAPANFRNEHAQPVQDEEIIF